MHRAHFDALLPLELRRVAPMVGRMLVVTAVVVALFVAAGRATPENMIAAFVGTGFGYLLAAPIVMLRDKLEGTIEVVRGLPIDTRDVTAAKFAAAAAAVVPAAAQVAGVLTWLGALRGRGADPVGQFLSAFVASWLALAAFSCLLAGVIARFDLESATAAPSIILAVLIVVVPLVVDRFVPDPVAALRWLVAQPWLPAVGALVTVAGVTGAVAVAFHLMRRGIDRYVPPAARA